MKPLHDFRSVALKVVALWLAIALFIGWRPADVRSEVEPVGDTAPQAAEPPVVNSLDQQLLDDLAPPRQDATKPPATPAERPDAEGGEDLGQGQSGDRIAQEIEQISNLMNGVGENLQRGELSPDVLGQQATIRSRLAQLIEELARQSSNKPQSASASASQSAAAQQPSASQGTVQTPTEETSPALTAADLKSDIWGHLPERWRQEMAAGPAEEFLPQYRELIESYFRRLAE